MFVNNSGDYADVIALCGSDFGFDSGCGCCLCLVVIREAIWY